MKGSWRNRQIVRTWNILVMLRARPRSLAEMAQAFGVNQRTIRRDPEALCEAQFPVTTTRDDLDRPRRDAYWSLAPIPSWPRHESTPVSDLPRVLNSGGYIGAIK